MISGVKFRCAVVVIIAYSICVLTVAQPPAHSNTQPRLDGIDRLASDLHEQWDVPGMALGIVQDGKIVFATGYGHRNAEQRLPVTTRTLFPIGSISKSFTALALAVLKDEGKIDWDKPVRQYLPTFQLRDSYASEHLTVRDMLTHRSGLPRHDLMWATSDFTRKELVDRLRYLEPTKELRSTYQYNNLMFMAAGYLAGEVSGSDWESLVRQSILDPLEMKSTNFRVADSERSPDYALPYAVEKRTIKQVPFKRLDAIGPAGGINSNIEDMLQYAAMLLGRGKRGDKQLVSEANLREIQSPQMVMGVAPQYPELGYPAYGMGWVIQSYRGHLYMWHNGGIDGFYALLCLLPNDNIGVVILTNRQRCPAAEILAYNIFDRLLNLDQLPWNNRFKNEETKQEQIAEEQRKKVPSDHKLGTHPAHGLEEYVGRYEHPGYGTLAITIAGQKLNAALNKLSFPLVHYHFEVFAIAPDGSDGALGLKLRFNTNMNGDVESVAIPLQPGVNDILFKRVDDKSNKVYVGSSK